MKGGRALDPTAFGYTAVEFREHDVPVSSPKSLAVIPRLRALRVQQESIPDENCIAYGLVIRGDRKNSGDDQGT